MEKRSIKLVSINIELARHLDAVRAFIRTEKPEIICLQEVCEDDLKEFAQEFGMEFGFAPMANIGKEKDTVPPLFLYGVGILSSLPLDKIERIYYRGSEEEARVRESKETSRDDPHALLYAKVKNGTENFTVGTTHFTWTPDGEADELQRSDLKRFLEVLKGFSDLILCGDFNAPRGRETFNTLAEQYKDNIPQHYTTSIDVNLHRDGDRLREESLMVDGLFTTPQYKCSNVRLVSGVSDHMAIAAEIKKTT